jgi:glycosyltransferase involved in cell wall biosynthesis
MTTRISVVVPTYRRPELLERCLEALSRSALAPQDFEIIVVHDGPSKTARRLAERWRAKLRAAGGPALRYRAPAHNGPAAARNVGWRMARSPIVAFTDDDTLPDPYWLPTALEAFEGRGLDAAWGRIVMPLGPNPTDYELDAARLMGAEFATANCFCRKEVLHAIAGFDERFEIAWREDSDLYFRLLAAHARVEYLSEALVLHPVRAAPWGVSLLQQKKVLFDALLFKKHRAAYRARIRRRPRWDYYAIVAALAAAAVGAMLDAGTLAVAGASLWSVLTARFCLERLRPASKCLSHVTEMIVTSVLIPPVAVFWRAVGAFRFGVVFL